MSDEYGDKFVRTGRPSCYADVETYDSRHPHCQSCPVRGSCSVQVTRKVDMETRGRREPGTGLRPTVVVQGQQVTQKTEAYEREDAGNSSWMDVLWHNGWLGAGETVARELVDGIRSIPRWKYPNPFKRKGE